MADICNFPGSENIKKLRELTESLPPAGPLTFSPITGATYVPDALSGSPTVIAVVKTDKIGIVIGIGGPGTVLARHQHKDEHQWVGVVTGQMHVEINGDKKVYNEKEFIYIPPGTPHTLSCIVYTEVWAVTMPPDPGWPHPSVVK